MPIEHSASLAIGVMSGAVSAVVQSAGPTPVNPFVVPLLSAAVGGLMSFAVLRTTVQAVERDLGEMKKDVKDISTRVARIEGKLHAD